MPKKSSSARRSGEDVSPLIDKAFAKVMHEIQRLEKAMAQGHVAGSWKTKSARRGGAR